MAALFREPGVQMKQMQVAPHAPLVFRPGSGIRVRSVRNRVYRCSSATPEGLSAFTMLILVALSSAPEMFPERSLTNR